MGIPTPAAPAGVSVPESLVPVAFFGRTSTLIQNYQASMRRQLRNSQEKLPPGFVITGHYWDIESGGLDLDERGLADLDAFDEVGIPRDGGIAALLAEAQAPSPKFAAVICEEIERSARDTFSALKLEKDLSAQGIPLFATDEPISVEGMNATTPPSGPKAAPKPA
jgi:site-specific DNA recombinase